MSTTTFELTQGEAACGVDLEDVHALRARALAIDSGAAVVLPADLAPALTGAAARLALGRAVVFSGFNQFSQPVYRREETAR